MPHREAAAALLLGPPTTRYKASLIKKGLDALFVEGYALPADAKVPPTKIGRLLTAKDANKLLDELDT